MLRRIRKTPRQLQLHDVDELSPVDIPANEEEWLLTKRDEEVDMDPHAAAHPKLGKGLFGGEGAEASSLRELLTEGVDINKAIAESLIERAGVVRQRKAKRRASNGRPVTLADVIAEDELGDWTSFVDGVEKILGPVEKQVPRDGPEPGPDPAPAPAQFDPKRMWQGIMNMMTMPGTPEPVKLALKAVLTELSKLMKSGTHKDGDSDGAAGEGDGGGDGAAADGAGSGDGAGASGDGGSGSDGGSGGDGAAAAAAGGAGAKKGDETPYVTKDVFERHIGKLTGAIVSLSERIPLPKKEGQPAA